MNRSCVAPGAEARRATAPGAEPLAAIPPDALARFDATLRARLDGPVYRFFSPRLNGRRVEPALAALLRHGEPGPGVLLNLGGGPFVLDFLLEQLRPWRIVSVDHSPAYARVYRALVEGELLARTAFALADLRDVEFAPAAFDGVVVHDVLFEPALDLHALLPRLARWLRPGGILYFDLWDRRARWLWRLAGRELPFRRYDLDRVRADLDRTGFEVVAETPFFGSRPVVRAARRVLWTCCRVSNTRHFVARRREETDVRAR